MLKTGGKTYGERLRLFRELQGRTLKEVALASGITESLLSQIERNKTSPSIDTLLRIAKTLQVDIEQLFKDYRPQSGVSILRKKERSRLEKDGVVYEQLSRFVEGSTETAVEAVLLELSPGAKKGSSSFGHKGKELGIILRGQVELQYGGASFPLGSGDTVSFDSTIPHTLVNTSNRKVRAIWIMSPPRITYFSP
ncbi:MAG: XRE family transcriptional regulator [Spirochaetales bacterium]